MSNSDVENLTNQLTDLKICNPQYVRDKNNTRLRAISLFSGLGGDTLGMQNAGFDVVAYVEKEDYIRKSHDANFPDCHLLGTDITKISDNEYAKFKDIDLIFAGFPCQGFSNAGKKNQDDPRNTLFKEFVRAVKIIRPKWIMGENVKGLLSRKTHDNLLYIDVITNEFETLGYKTTYKLCKSHLYGVPQKRERLLILGTLDRTNPLQFPREQNEPYPNLTNIIKFDMRGCIPITKNDYDFNAIPEECIITDMTNSDEHSPKLVHPYLKLLLHEKEKSYNNKSYSTLLSFGSRDSPIHAEIVDIRQPCKTVICTYGRQPRFYVAQRNKIGDFLRCLNPMELKQIQGFPIKYIVIGSYTQKVTQIGNAVPPPLITAILTYNLNCSKKIITLPKLLPTDENELWSYVCDVINKDFDLKTFEQHCKNSVSSETQKNSSYMEKMIADILDQHGITYKRAKSQQPDDFQKIAGTNLKFDCKKITTNTVTLNDSYPTDKKYVICRVGNKSTVDTQLIFKTWEELCCPPFESKSHEQELESYMQFEKELKTLLKKYKGKEHRFLFQRISCFPRPNLFLHIDEFVKVNKTPKKIVKTKQRTVKTQQKKRIPIKKISDSSDSE